MNAAPSIDSGTAVSGTGNPVGCPKHATPAWRLRTTSVAFGAWLLGSASVTPIEPSLPWWCWFPPSCTSNGHTSSPSFDTNHAGVEGALWNTADVLNRTKKASGTAKESEQQRPKRVITVPVAWPAATLTLVLTACRCHIKEVDREGDAATSRI